MCNDVAYRDAGTQFCCRYFWVIGWSGGLLCCSGNVMLTLVVIWGCFDCRSFVRSTKYKTEAEEWKWSFVFDALIPESAQQYVSKVGDA